MRGVRNIVIVILFVAIVAGALVVFTRRPDLEDARKAVDSSWDTAAPALDARYSVLAAANNNVKGTPGPVGVVAKDVDDALQDWLRARRAADRDRSIAVANRLEGLGRRLALVVHASPRVSKDAKATGGVDAFVSS